MVGKETRDQRTACNLHEGNSFEKRAVSLDQHGQARCVLGWLPLVSRPTDGNGTTEQCKNTAGGSAATKGVTTCRATPRPLDLFAGTNLPFILRLTHSLNVGWPAHERTLLACTKDTDTEGVMLLTHSLLRSRSQRSRGVEPSYRHLTARHIWC